MIGDPAEPRELLGRLVRQVWVQWAREQPDPKPSWLTPWEELDDGQKEVDMRIGEKLFKAGQDSVILFSFALVTPAPLVTSPSIRYTDPTERNETREDDDTSTPPEAPEW